MSPNVSSFVHDLVQMAQATERLPQLESENFELRAKADQLGQSITDREERIIALKAEIEVLNAKVRSAEEARDQAETMFLECDDKLSAFRRVVANFNSDLAQLVVASMVQPPAPTPMAVQSEEQVSGVSVSVDPTPAPVDQTGTGMEHAASGSEPVYGIDWGKPDAPAIPADVPQGQSDPLPTPSYPTGEGTTPSVTPPVSSPEPGPAIGQPEMPPVDSTPGYHNEPLPRYSLDWYDWAYRMDAHYGIDHWPSRQAATA